VGKLKAAHYEGSENMSVITDVGPFLLKLDAYLICFDMQDGLRHKRYDPQEEIDGLVIQSGQVWHGPYMLSLEAYCNVKDMKDSIIQYTPPLRPY
jgi:hypothetical protein